MFLEHLTQLRLLLQVLDNTTMVIVTNTLQTFASVNPVASGSVAKGMQSSEVKSLINQKSEQNVMFVRFWLNLKIYRGKLKYWATFLLEANNIIEKIKLERFYHDKIIWKLGSGRYKEFVCAVGDENFNIVEKTQFPTTTPYQGQSIKPSVLFKGDNLAGLAIGSFSRYR